MARSDELRLAGRVVVVDIGAAVRTSLRGSRVADVALAVAADGATVVVAGTDAEAAGALAAQVEAAGGRAAVFTGDPARDADRAALGELLAELFD